MFTFKILQFIGLVYPHHIDVVAVRLYDKWYGLLLIVHNFHCSRVGILDLSPINIFGLLSVLTH